MNRKYKKLIQVLAIILVVLMVGGVIVSALVSALAEESPEQALPRDRYEIAVNYIEAERALQIEQRLVYFNRTGDHLDRVVFYAAGNMLRRESALMYEPDDLAAVFPSGFAPGGIQLTAVRLDAEAVDYGFVGEDEMYLRVGCDLEPGDSAEFAFDYVLLLPECGAFIGADDTDVRLSAFYFIPGVYDPSYREFIVNKPLSFTRWLFSEPGDYAMNLTLPEKYALAATGAVSGSGGQWRVEAENVREIAFSLGKRWRAADDATASGLELRLMSSLRDGGRVLSIARSVAEQCEAWFGPAACPANRLTLAVSGEPLDALNFPGLILLPERLLARDSEAELKRQIRFCVTQQYFGMSACVEPSADAWLSDSLCEYLAYLILEAEEGHEAFLNAINRDWVSALQLTIPGGLTVTSDAKLFDAYEYDIVVKKRGAVVFHELREAMGLEDMLAGLAAFYRLGRDGHVLTEMDLVHCLDAASGRSWEDFLTDWVFNVGDYVNQAIDWFS